MFFLSDFLRDTVKLNLQTEFDSFSMYCEILIIRQRKYSEKGLLEISKGWETNMSESLISNLPYSGA